MSQWKFFIDRSKDNQSNHSGSRAKKYTPKKSFNDQQSPSRFHNRTVDKANSSMMSQQKEKSVLGRSFIGKNNQNDVHRELKSSASQIKLQKNLNEVISKKTTLDPHTVAREHLNQNSRVKSKSFKNNVSMKIQKSLLFDEIQRLKKQFIQFQSIILRQLHRQQKIINNMMQQILNKLKQVSQQPENKKQYIKIQAPHTPRQKPITSTIKNFEKKNSMDQGKHEVNLSDNYLKFNENSIPLLNFKNNFDGSSQISDVKHKTTNYKFSFERFFQAMNNLKKDIKDLNQITDIHTIQNHEQRLCLQNLNQGIKIK